MPNELDMELDEGNTKDMQKQDDKQPVQQPSGRKTEAVIEELKKQLQEKTKEFEKVNKNLEKESSKVKSQNISIQEFEAELKNLKGNNKSLKDVSFNELLVELKNRSLDEREQILLNKFEEARKDFIRIFGTDEGPKKFRIFMQEEIEGKLMAMGRKSEKK